MNKTYKNKINVIADFDLQVEKFAEIKTTYEDRTLEGIMVKHPILNIVQVQVTNVYLKQAQRLQIIK